MLTEKSIHVAHIKTNTTQIPDVSQKIACPHSSWYASNNLSGSGLGILHNDAAVTNQCRVSFALYRRLWSVASTGLSNALVQQQG